MSLSTAFSLLADLVRKYNRPGPRYTSYPTAPHFQTGFTGEDFLAGLKPSDREGDSDDLSLYVHLPFCRSLCHYCGCHMLVTHRPEKIAQYVAYVEREIDLVAARAGRDRRVVQIHWGGGTPTYLSPEQIVRLMSHIRSRFSVWPGAEISIEADPRGLTKAHVTSARDAGFNRISFGVQDFDPVVQEAINRVQPAELVEQATQWARQQGFEGVSFDLIYGLPHQTPERFGTTVQQVLGLAPDRISLFSYAHVPWMKKHQRLIDECALPAPEAKLETFLLAVERLTEGGAYEQIGMDHFVRPQDSLHAAYCSGTMQRNFQGYSTHAGAELYGFGTSSISQLRNAYAQNELELPAYYAAVDAGTPPTRRGYRMTPDDHMRREVIMKLMCNFALDVPRIEQRYGIRSSEKFAGALHRLIPLEEDGLVSVSADRIEVTGLGRYFIRNIAMCFDAYLDTAAAQPRVAHSSTV